MDYKKAITFARSNKGSFIIVMFIMIGVFIFRGVYSQGKIKILQSKGLVTPGVTIRKVHLRGDYILYKYEVEGKMYKGKSLYVRGVKVSGGKYLVIYNPDDPEMNTIIYSREVGEELGATIINDIGNEEIKESVLRYY